MADAWIKRGDLLPAINATLVDSSGNAVDLSDADGVRFSMRTIRGFDVVIAEAEAIIADAPAGKVSYPWQFGDTDEAGGFFGEFEVDWADGPETFPNDGWIKIAILEDLEGVS